MNKTAFKTFGPNLRKYIASRFLSNLVLKNWEEIYYRAFSRSSYSLL